MKQPFRKTDGKFRFKPTLQLEASLSLAAFLMSLSITLINIYYALRGAEIAVDPPVQLILYRDGADSASILTAAVRLDMINVADGYGDVLKTASVEFDRGRGTFEYEGTLRTVFTGGSPTIPPCELGLRCLQLPGLYVIERTDEILDIPSGAARGFTLSFPVVSWNCASKKTQNCGLFKNFSSSLSALPRNGLDLIVRLRFHNDGHRKLRCKTAPINREYLQRVGWLSLPCTVSQT